MNTLRKTIYAFQGFSYWGNRQGFPNSVKGWANPGKGSGKLCWENFFIGYVNIER